MDNNKKSMQTINAVKDVLTLIELYYHALYRGLVCNFDYALDSLYVDKKGASNDIYAKMETRNRLLGLSPTHSTEILIQHN